MVFRNALPDVVGIELLDTLLPDFVLAFTFFTALSYTTLGRFFGRQRPAIAMSAALGLALAIGLVWWERDHGAGTWIEHPPGSVHRPRSETGCTLLVRLPAPIEPLDGPAFDDPPSGSESSSDGTSVEGADSKGL